MPYTLNELADDIKDIVQNNKIPNGSDQICYFVSKALNGSKILSLKIFLIEQEGTSKRSSL